MTSGQYQKKRRNERKEKLVSIKGGKCRKCGYSKSISALLFHHRNESTKKFNISGNNLNRYRWDALKDEAAKCELLCANCHAETHDEEGWVHEGGKRTRKAPRKIAACEED